MRAEIQNPKLSEAAQALLDLLSGRATQLPPVVWQRPEVQDEFVGLCFAHQVHPIVARLLRRLRPDLRQQAEPLLGRLEADREARVAHLLGATRQLAELVQTFEARGIRFLALKGVALLGTQYAEDPLERPFSDLDLLFEESHFEVVLTTFQNLGYALAQHKQDVTALRRYNQKLEFRPVSARPCSVDVHFCLIGKKLFNRNACLDLNAFWRQARRRTSLATPCLVPGPEHLLLHQSLHLSLQHHLASLRWLYDLKRLIDTEPGLDWAQFVRDVQSARATRAVWLSLNTAVTLLGAKVPEQTLRALTPAGLGWLDRVWLRAQQNSAHLLSQRFQHRQKSLAGKIWRMFAEVVLVDSLPGQSRFRVLAGWLFPNPYWFRVSYRARSNGALAWCYLVHPLVVFGVGFGVVGLALREEWRARRRAPLPVFRPGTFSPLANAPSRSHPPVSLRCI